MADLLVATWNINSVRARIERLVDWLDRRNPDVVCLQETKCTEDQFPYDEIGAAGYRAVVLGQPTYNGVAILTRNGVTDVQHGLPGDESDTQARLIAADVGDVRIVNIYVPNGKSVGTEPYAYKLSWLDRLEKWLPGQMEGERALVLCGDFNIAPTDADAAFPDRWASSVLCDRAVRDAFGRLTALGLRDLVREEHEPPGPFTWWDYRRLAFPKGDGLRIDHVLASTPAADRCIATEVDREERKGQKPSDHAPVLARFSS